MMKFRVYDNKEKKYSDKEFAIDSDGNLLVYCGLSGTYDNADPNRYAVEMSTGLNEIFPEDEILRYVKDQYSPEDIFDNEILRYVKDQYSPEDIFDKNDLQNWAEENGYVKENNK